ncbi:MAG: RNA polymerase sigma factor RpoD/SigA [Bacteroidia bacterium]|nr:RNA polymerase sigma factor RpoD/SigA [Bacteroidia bacterium]MDW8157930.1 RNA polymerase sigma factor RpoD/SigA [Bacteroidia bacterium]
MRTFKVTRKITTRNSSSINKYFHEINKIRLLSPDEEVCLARKAKQGDDAAFNKLVKANLRFVVSVAKQYQNQGLELEELIQEGNLGLMKAIRKYDETTGFRFISYAVWWIRQTILEALAEHARLIRLPVNRIGTINKVRRAEEALEKCFHRNPTVEEIAQELKGIDPEDIEEAICLSKTHTVSLQSPLDSGSKEEDTMLVEKLENPEATAPDNELVKQSLCVEIESCLRQLSAREAKVLRLYFGIGKEQPHTLEEIGLKLGLTRERVRQIKEKALKRIRRNPNLLQTYLE